MPAQNLYAGIGSAIAVIFIWSGYIVFSRAGVITSLTAYDITALRFMVAGLIVAPFAWHWWPRHLSWKALGLLALCGILLGLPVIKGGGASIATGIAFFLSASAVLSIYIYGVRHWQLTPRQVLVMINIPNALIYLPIWYFLLPSGMVEADGSMVAFQALYQGLGPGFLALILFTIAAVNLGPTVTAGFSAVVPASAAVLAIPVLLEYPAPVEWTGIAVVTVGLGLLIFRRS